MGRAARKRAWGRSSGDEEGETWTRLLNLND